MKKAVIAGFTCLDMTPLFPKQQKREAHELFVPGKLLRMEGVQITCGGAVPNTGLAMKLLGTDVQLMGKIADDAFGRIILNTFQKYGYDGSKDMIIAKEGTTGYSLVLSPPGIDRIFLLSAGINDTFGYEDLDYASIAKATLFHFGYPPHLRRMYLNDGEELKRIFAKVKSLGCMTSLDMAAVDAASEAGRADWEKILTKVLPYVDFFVPSVEELCFMLDPNRHAHWLRRAANRDVTEILNIQKDIKPLADKVSAMGAKILLIKCGAPGLYYRTASADSLAAIESKANISLAGWANQEGFEPSYQPDILVSGTGAGDTTIAAFLSAMLQEYSFHECLRLATATGASCVTAYDALSGLKTFAELKEKMANGWEKLSKPLT